MTGPDGLGDGDLEIILATAKDGYIRSKSASDFDFLLTKYPARFDAIAKVFAETAVELGQDREWIRIMKAAEVRSGQLSPLHAVFVRAQNERTERDLAELATAGPTITFFACGRGAARPTCHRCSRGFTQICGAPGCDLHLCDDHARSLDGTPRCSAHAPSTTTSTMPRPPGRPR